MAKKFVCLLVAFLTVGCAKIITVTPPNLNTTFDPSMPFSAPEQPKFVKMIPKDGKRSIRQDDVIVQVDNVVSTDNESEYTVSVQDPSEPNKSYQFKLFPMMLKLKMTNNSNHIITLTKTIVKLEDENQNDYPMVNTLSEQKQKLSSQIQHAYNPFTSDFLRIGVEICKKKLNL